MISLPRLARLRRAALAVSVLAVVLTLIPAGGPARAAGPAAVAFDQIVAATDGPLLFGAPLLERDEPYREGPDGRRAVRYHAKGRLELTDPAAGTGAVAHGRLVHELMTGELAAGDARDLLYAGADIPLVGDRDRGRNPDAPTYRSLRSLTPRAASAVGLPVTTVLLPPEGAGVLSLVVAARRDPALGQLAVNAVYLNDVGRNVPAVFWRLLTAQGAPGGRTLTWTALFGWPLTDAFWVKAHQAGRPVEALVQPFERRLLIYRPDAPPGEQVLLGDVGRDYLAWRDGLVNAAPDLRPAPSTNGVAVPPVGEAGTVFTLLGVGFRPGEAVDSWMETGGATYPVLVPARPGGIWAARLRTLPIQTAPADLRIVVQGRESGHTSVIQLRILATDPLTPGAEAAEPVAVPPGRGGATIEPAVLAVGQVGTLQAAGFAPGEAITAWITTGLHRVIPYATYVGSVSRAGAGPTTPAVSARLQADAAGVLRTGLPGPGLANTGVYAVTLVGATSGHAAIAYYRTRAGEVQQTNYFYGVSLQDLLGRRIEAPLATLPPVVEAVEATVELADLLARVGLAGARS